MTANASAASNAAAAQRYYDDRDRPGFPPIAPLLVILATIAVAIYILVKDDDHGHIHLPLPEPVSPN